jgi:phage-related protein
MGFWDNVTSTVSNVTSTVADTAQNAVSSVSSTVSSSIETVEKTGQDFISGAQSTTSSTGRIIQQTGGDIMNSGSDLVKGIEEATTDLTSTVIGEVTKETEVYKETTYNVFDSITQTIAEDTQGIFKGGQDISKEILRVEQSAEEALEGVVDEAGQVVSGVAGQIVSIPKGLGNLANVASSPNTILLVGGIAIVAILLM